MTDWAADNGVGNTATNYQQRAAAAALATTTMAAVMMEARAMAAAKAESMGEYDGQKTAAWVAMRATARVVAMATVVCDRKA